MNMDEAQVRKAVLALQQYQATKTKEKRKLIEENPLISLIIGLKKIPNKSMRPQRIPLPHSMFPPDETEMCLFVKKEKKSAKSLLERKKVQGVTKIISLSKLKTDYKSFESKKHLSCYYDIYLADKRIYHILPQFLGKSFFVKKKFPFPVDMRKKDLAGELSTARDSTYLHLGLGSCVSLPVGRLAWPADHTVANVMVAIQGAVTKIPQGWRNIQVVHLKSVDSIALPVYNALPPGPKLLPNVLFGPPSKRMKLDPVEPISLTPVVDISRNAVGGEDEGESEGGGEEEGGGRRRKVGGGDGVERRDCVSGSLGGILVPNPKETENSPDKCTPTPATQRKKVKTSSVPRFSAKKVRGSTVISSRYQKITQRKTGPRKSL